MAEQFAGLTLGVNVEQLNKAVKSLQDFKKANDEAKKGVDDFVNHEEVAKQKAKQLAAELAKQRKEFSNINDIIDPTAAKMRKLTQAASDLDKLWQKGVVPDEDFFKLGSMLETQINKLNASKKALTEEGRATIEEARAKEKAANATKNFLADLEAQASALGKTKAELLEIKAAQLGVSAQAAPFIAQLKGQEKQMKLAGISAGQYTQAIRQLPMQITDVVTSLASGMPIWMIAIQQGGQIKDSFGGVGNTFKVLLSYLNPLNIAMAGLVVTLGAFVKAGYDSYKGQRDLQEALVLTGGYAGKTAAEFNKLSEGIANTTNATVGNVREIATSLAKSGKYTIDQIKAITKTTAQWAATTGESKDKITAYFDKIASDPVKGLAELNEQFNFLSDGQLTYIDKLEQTKGKTEAVTAATKLFADVMEERIARLADSATPLEKMWNDIKQWSSEAWSWVGDHTLAALNLIIDVVARTVDQVKYLLNQGNILIGEFLISATKALQKIPGAGEVGKGVIDAQSKIVSDAKKLNADLEKSIQERNARIAKGEQGYIDTVKNREETDKQYLAKQKENIRKELAAIEERNKKAGKAAKVEVSAGDKLSEQYQRDILALQVQLKVLKEHKNITDSISQQRKSLFAEQAKIQILEEAAKKRTLTDEEKSVLANKDKVLMMAEQKAVLGDQIVAQTRLNQLQDNSVKFVKRQQEATEALMKSRGLSDRMAQREAERAKVKADYFAAGGKKEDPQLKAMMDALDQRYAKEDELRADWLAGAQKAFAEYEEDALNMYDNIGNIAGTALNGLSSVMTDFLTTGEANFKDFASSIIKMIVEMITKMVIFNSLTGMGIGGGSPITIGSLFKGFASGGYTGDGGKYDPAGVVHKGEFVFTKEATQRIGAKNLYRLMRGYANGGQVGGSASGGSMAMGCVNLNLGDIEVNVNNGSDPKGLGNGVKMIFTNMIKESCTQGGEIYEFVMSRT